MHVVVVMVGELVDPEDRWNRNTKTELEFADDPEDEDIIVLQVSGNTYKLNKREFGRVTKVLLD